MSTSQQHGSASEGRSTLIKQACHSCGERTYCDTETNQCLECDHEGWIHGGWEGTWDPGAHAQDGHGPECSCSICAEWDAGEPPLLCQVCGVEESAETKIVLFDNTKALDPMFPPDETAAELCEACEKGLRS